MVFKLIFLNQKLHQPDYDANTIKTQSKKWKVNPTSSNNNKIALVGPDQIDGSYRIDFRYNQFTQPDARLSLDPLLHSVQITPNCIFPLQISKFLRK